MTRVGRVGRWWVGVAIAWGLGGVLAVTVGAQSSPPGDLDAVLALPLSPGAVARLVEFPLDPRTQKRLTAALADPDPAVRTVAARVTFVTGSKGQVSGLVRALASEQDRAAAVEELRALVTFLGAPVDEQAMAAATRLGSPVADTMAEVVARRSATDLLRLLPQLRQIQERRTTYAEALAIASVQHPEAAAEIAASLVAEKNEPWIWQIYLNTLRENAALVDEPALLQALGSSTAAVRNASVWHVALAVLDGDGFGDDVLKAAGRKEYSARSKDLTWEDFGRELLARVRGEEPSGADWASLVGDPKGSGRSGVTAEMYGYLTKAEVRALGLVRDDKEAGQIKRIMRSGRKALKEVRARSTTMRTFYAFAPGLLTDLRAASGCKAAPDDQFVAGQVTYRPDGRPKSIQLVESGVSKECQRFGRLAILLSVAADDQPVDADLQDQVIVLFDREFMTCADGPHVVARARPVAGDRGPMVTKKVSYETPDAARRLQLTGVVRVSALVSHTGCVSYVETRRSLHPLYDLAIIYAMKDWRYAPATVQGAPVEGVASVSFEVIHH